MITKLSLQARYLPPLDLWKIKYGKAGIINSKNWDYSPINFILLAYILSGEQ
jgi:hypothetical protein